MDDDKASDASFAVPAHRDPGDRGLRTNSAVLARAKKPVSLELTLDKSDGGHRHWGTRLE